MPLSFPFSVLALSLSLYRTPDKGCVPCFYDDTIFYFHLSENNIFVCGLDREKSKYHTFYFLWWKHRPSTGPLKLCKWNHHAPFHILDDTYVYVGTRKYENWKYLMVSFWVLNFPLLKFTKNDSKIHGFCPFLFGQEQLKIRLS